MKRSILCAAVAAIALSAPTASAKDTKPAPAGSASGKPAAGMDMDKQMAQIQENVKRMQLQMDRIHQAKDPKERHELMDEHAKTMQENMQMMRGMGGPMMMDTMGGQKGGMGPGMMGGSQKGAMGPGMMGGGQMMGGNPMAGMDPKQQQDFMQRRMDVMQMMMEQMMRHQQMMRIAPAK